jgi:hypothetical protein
VSPPSPTGTAATSSNSSTTASTPRAPSSPANSPQDAWHDYLSDPTLADAILDRLIHNAHHLRTTGDERATSDLFAILANRDNQRATIVASQSNPDYWEQPQPNGAAAE